MNTTKTRKPISKVRKVGQVPLSKLQGRVNFKLKADQHTPLNQIRLGTKIKYNGQIWQLARKEPIGKDWYQVTLERGLGETAESRSMRMRGAMSLLVHIS